MKDNIIGDIAIIPNDQENRRGKQKIQEKTEIVKTTARLR